MELLVEYMALMLCIYKVAKQKIKFSLWIFFPFLIEWAYVIWNETGKISIVCKIIVLIGIFMYTKIKIGKTWKRTLNAFGIGILVMLSLQVLQYYLLKFIVKSSYIAQYEIIIVNFNICIFAFLWKEKGYYLYLYRCRSS